MGGYLPVEIKRNEEGQSFFADVRVINIVTRWPGSDSVKIFLVLVLLKF